MTTKDDLKNETANITNPVLYAVLSKYIQYIKDVEGTDYILIHDERYMSDVKFTDAEWKILTDMATALNGI